MPNQYESFSHPQNAASVTPNDSTDLSNAGILYVGGAGDVRVNTAAGQNITFSGMTAGSFLPVQVTRVYSTNTTATNLIVLY